MATTTTVNGNNHPRLLLHVHVCIHCTASFRREEVEGRVHMTGLFVCTKCGKEGPLNIEIVEVEKGDSHALAG